jgi:hypothetical protein
LYLFRLVLVKPGADESVPAIFVISFVGTVLTVPPPNPLKQNENSYTINLGFVVKSILIAALLRYVFHVFRVFNNRPISKDQAGRY